MKNIEVIHSNSNNQHINGGNSNLEKTTKEQEEYQEVETFVQIAIDAAGFGKFNILIALISAFVFANSAISLTSSGFILPAAACDFNMNTVDKGRMPVVLISGVVIGAIVWSFVTDLKGRKYALLFCLFLQGGSEFFMSFVPNYWCFLCLRFLSGLGVSGQITLVFTYTSEFQPTKFRKRMLSLLDLAWIVGLLFVPLIAWIIFTLKFEYKAEFFSFRSWNLFVLICSLPGLIIGLFLFWFPETPKFLANNKQYSRLLKVLVVMYEKNTGKSAKDYFSELEKEDNPVLRKIVHTVANFQNPEELEEKKSLKVMLKEFKTQAKGIIYTPYLKRMLIGSLCAFMIVSPYNTLLLWFPELLQRFAKFEQQFPNESSSVCIVSQKTELPATNFSLSIEPIICDQSIHNEVFTDTLWLAASCIPPAILLPLLVDKLGFKFFLVCTTLISSLATLGLFFVKSSFQNMIASCIFESTNSIAISILYCCLVEIFPTNFRILAMSVAVLSGRIGALVGNLIFGYFIDNYCTPVIITLSGQLFLGAILSYIL